MVRADGSGYDEEILNEAETAEFLDRLEQRGEQVEAVLVGEDGLPIDFLGPTTENVRWDDEPFGSDRIGRAVSPIPSPQRVEKSAENPGPRKKHDPAPRGRTPSRPPWSRQTPTPETAGDPQPRASQEQQATDHFGTRTRSAERGSDQLEQTRRQPGSQAAGCPS